MRPLIVALSLLALVAAPAHSQRAPKPLTIRVLVATAPAATLTFPADHAAFYADGSVLHRSGAPLEWRLSSRNNRIAIETPGGAYDTGRDRVFLDSPPGGAFTLNGRLYRGGATVIARGANLNVINALDIEDYVLGVLPEEMPSSWPAEALRAQAIIARTYAISRLNQNGDYDVCATTACQVYGGASVETPRANQAAADTRGLIVAYGNRPAKTYFHADSGGFTASSREVWGEALPYLVARPDPESRSPKSPWRAVPDARTISNVTARFAARAGAYRAMRVTGRTESGRVNAVEVTGDAGTVTLTAGTARDFVRALGAQSTLAEVTSAQPLVLEGAGWGHGVGLSQWGARGFAALGWTYDQILGYYYPGVSLANYEVP